LEDIKMNRTLLPLVCTTLGLVACDPGAEYRAALPDRDTVTLGYPERAGTSESGLARRALVGERSDLYTQTYYAAKELNGFGKLVVDVLEAITAYPPTKYDESSASWGPFSEPREPNEWQLTVRKVEERYDWRLEGRPKGVKDFVAFGHGTFAPEEKGAELGEGWFTIDFDALKKLNPAEDAQGVVGYAFEKTSEHVNVRVRFHGPNEDGTIVDAAYAFDEDRQGNGSVIFAYPGDLDEGQDGKRALEDVTVRTRWLSDGSGRADIQVVGGDLGDGSALGVQCWGTDFVSSYEHIESSKQELIASAGKAETCSITDAAPISKETLPEETDVTNPYAQQ
jgi:hypothetical protein